MNIYWGCLNLQWIVSKLHWILWAHMTGGNFYWFSEVTHLPLHYSYVWRFCNHQDCAMRLWNSLSIGSMALPNNHPEENELAHCQLEWSWILGSDRPLHSQLELPQLVGLWNSGRDNDQVKTVSKSIGTVMMNFHQCPFCLTLCVMNGGQVMWHLNSLRPSDAYMGRWTGSSLVQIMACRLFGAKPLSEPMLEYC